MLAVFMSTAVWAQIMVIRHSDGSVQRLYAGNIDEIYFETEPQVAEGAYTDLSVDAHLGNFILKFTGIGMPELSLDVVTDKTAYLHEGVYPVVNSDTVTNVINGRFLNTTYVDMPDGRKPVTGGRMTVSSDDVIYTISLELEFGGHDLLMARYVGDAKEASRYVKIPMTQAFLLNNPEGGNEERLIRLINEDESAAVWISLWCYSDYEELYPGVFPPAEEQSVGYYNVRESRMELYFPHQTLPLIGNVILEGENSVDEIKCRAIAPDGRIYVVEFHGTILPEDDTPEEYRPVYLKNDEPEDNGGEYDYYLVANLNNGDIITCPFEERPSVSFDDSRLMLRMELKEVLNVEISDVHNFVISRKEHLSLREIKKESCPEIRFLKYAVHIKGLRNGESVKLCSLEGMVFRSAEASPEGDITVETSGGTGEIMILLLPERNISMKLRKQ